MAKNDFRVTSIFKIIIRNCMKNVEFCRKTSEFLPKRCIFSVWLPKRKHRFCHHHFSFIINLNVILNFYIVSSSLTKMVRTRSQLENLSKEELIEELITVDNISSKLSDLSNRFDYFLRRFEVVSFDLGIGTVINY